MEPRTEVKYCTSFHVCAHILSVPVLRFFLFSYSLLSVLSMLASSRIPVCGFGVVSPKSLVFRSVYPLLATVWRCLSKHFICLFPRAFP